MKRILVAAAVGGMSVAGALVAPAAAATVVTTSVSSFYVSPAGNDANAGRSPTAPFETIQQALDTAPSGSVVHLAPGTYLQDVVTTRSGITITGPRTAVVKGGGAARIWQVRHDDITLSGFTIDGLFGDPDSIDGYRDKLVYAMSTTPGDGIDRLRLRGLTLANAGGECVRLRYLVTRADVADNHIGPCGVYDFRFDDGGKNGEGVYVGTAPEQQGLNGAPDARADISTSNRVHRNTIDTEGNECVDIKENSTGNIVEDNVCTGQRDPESGGFDSRGSGNTFRDNRVYDNAGAGIRFGGDASTDGTGNNAYGNSITGNAMGGIKFQATPQGTVCGNTMASNVGGNSVGAYADLFDPAAPCAGGVHAGTTCTFPAEVLDLTNWKETLPVDDPHQSGTQPLEIKQPDLATYALDPWFVATPACDAVRFRAAVNGTTTSGSSYPRSELREMQNDGSSNASWSSTDGTHTMVIDEAITAEPQGRPNVVAGQIHDANDDITVFRLEGSSLWITNGDTTHYKLVTDSYVLGTRFEAKFVAAGGQIEAYYNGVLQTTLDADISGAYFKAGAYTQANCGNTSPCADTNYGEVLIYGVTVTHQ